MKIAILTPFYKPSMGGVEHIAYHLAKKLVERGFEVHVITTNCDNRWKIVSKQECVVEENIIVHRLSPSIIRIGYATIMKDLKRNLRDIRPDIVHCHNLHQHLFQVLKWKDEMGYKVVAQLHHPVATGIDHPIARLLYKPTMKILAQLSNEIDVFVAHTYLEKQWLVNEGIEENKITIIRFPCIPDELLNHKPTSDIHDVLSADKVITYVSRIHPRKGQHLLVEAARHLKQEVIDFKVYIAGPPANRSYSDSLRKLIEKHRLEKHIVLEQRTLLEKEKNDVIASSDIFALTSLKEYTPVILLEAIALRTPVVATAVGAIPELLSICNGAKEAVRMEFIKNLKVLIDARRLVRVVNPEPYQIAMVLKEMMNGDYAGYRHTLATLASLHSVSILTESLVRVYSL
jgi:glycosyltransferase involved in cell wall biosynthesis